MNTTLHAPSNGNFTINTKVAALILVLLVSFNVFSFLAWGKNYWEQSSFDNYVYFSNSNNLYLMDEAALFVENPNNFEKKVREISEKLDIKPEWLMAVMYLESKFNANIENYKGSGAIGLIQFMPNTAKDFKTTTNELKKMTPTRQLDYVYAYLQNVKQKYGDFDGLTELYLGVLYPKALENKDFCFTLFAKPTNSYLQNSGLDENKDGIITVKDIDKRMKRMFPEAYILSKEA